MGKRKAFNDWSFEQLSLKMFSWARELSYYLYRACLFCLSSRTGSNKTLLNEFVKLLCGGGIIILYTHSVFFKSD